MGRHGSLNRRLVVAGAIVTALTWMLGGQTAALSQSAVTVQEATEKVDLTRTHRVGPSRLYKRPSEVAKIAKDGDTVEIDAGEYIGDVAVWRQNNLTLRGVGGLAHLKADGKNAQGKAIWVIGGDDVVIESIEFSGAKVRDRNGAGIRQEGSNLTVRNSVFHDNENGILAGKKVGSTITIEDSIFYDNYGRDRRGRAHNIYIGQIDRFVLTGSIVRGAVVSHNVKTRAKVNEIINNRIVDESEGAASYLLDLSNAGVAYVIGNLFHQNPKAKNSHLMSFGPEGLKYDDNRLYVINNTFVNDRRNAVFIMNRSETPAAIVNNLFVGKGKIVTGPADLENNLHEEDGWFSSVHLKDREKYDFHLTAGSPAIDSGLPRFEVDGMNLVPTRSYQAPTGTVARTPGKAIDIGALEYQGD